jgi:hypothetical protein
VPYASAKIGPMSGLTSMAATTAGRTPEERLVRFARELQDESCVPGRGRRGRRGARDHLLLCSAHVTPAPNPTPDPTPAPAPAAQQLKRTAQETSKALAVLALAVLALAVLALALPILKCG